MYEDVSPLPARAQISDHLTTLAWIACIAFLAFVAGSYTMYRGFFPASTLRGAFQGGLAYYEKITRYEDPYWTDFWQPARTQARGVVHYDAAKAQNGLTLYTSSAAQTAILMDMDGRTVHEWTLPFSKVWDETSAVSSPQPDSYIQIEKAHAFPNGDLLALYTASGDTPWGYGLVKMDKDSNVVWKYLAHAHHDFDVTPSGEIYVLTHEISKTDLPGYAHLNKPRIDDYLVKLSPDGEELKKVWLTGALAQSRFGDIFHFVPEHRNGDYLHTNAVFVLKKAVPGIPQSRAGQVLVSFREISTIALVEPETSKIVWAQSGPWLLQHDPEFLPNGHLLVFDNRGNPTGIGPSRILEIDPQDFRIAWRYGGRPGERLDSIARGSQVRLRNGNTLIAESFGGRLLEVTPDGEIAWEFVSPVRRGDNNDRVPIIQWVERLDPQQDLAPGFRRNLRLE